MVRLSIHWKDDDNSLVNYNFLVSDLCTLLQSPDWRLVPNVSSKGDQRSSGSRTSKKPHPEDDVQMSSCHGTSGKSLRSDNDKTSVIETRWRPENYTRSPLHRVVFFRTEKIYLSRCKSETEVFKGPLKWQESCYIYKAITCPVKSRFFQGTFSGPIGCRQKYSTPSYA